MARPPTTSSRISYQDQLCNRRAQEIRGLISTACFKWPCPRWTWPACSRRGGGRLRKLDIVNFFCFGEAGRADCVLGACNAAALSAVAVGRLALEVLTIVRMRQVSLHAWIGRRPSPNAFAVTRQPIILGTAICIIPFLATRLVAGFSWPRRLQQLETQKGKKRITRWNAKASNSGFLDSVVIRI